MRETTSGKPSHVGHQDSQRSALGANPAWRSTGVFNGRRGIRNGSLTRRAFFHLPAPGGAHPEGSFRAALASTGVAHRGGPGGRPAGVAAPRHLLDSREARPTPAPSASRSLRPIRITMLHRVGEPAANRPSRRNSVTSPSARARPTLRCAARRPGALAMKCTGIARAGGEMPPRPAAQHPPSPSLKSHHDDPPPRRAGFRPICKSGYQMLMAQRSPAGSGSPNHHRILHGRFTPLVPARTGDGAAYPIAPANEAIRPPQKRSSIARSSASMRVMSSA